jgi:hypothetical protein
MTQGEKSVGELEALLDIPATHAIATIGGAPE